MLVRQTNTLIIGASISGLASAACLQKQKIDYIIIEKQARVAAPWSNHYDRLHLHTCKRLSHLPYKKFGRSITRYPSRQQVIDYLEDYQKEFIINPVFNTEAISVKRVEDYWISPTGQIREIAADARKIARDIARQEKF
ncbi:MAG TPA: NAD(P)-binding protein [Puia sp.]|nr:NAD(P)-binding protein [Puia sp.]